MAIFKKNKNNEVRSFFPEGAHSVTSTLSFTADRNPTVATCIDRIAKTFSTLTPTLYAYTKGGKKLAVGNPVFHVLEHPAYEETPALFWGTLLRFLLYKGNAYIFKSYSTNGELVDLSLVNPSDVTVSRDDGNRKTYNIRGKIYTDREILHIPYPGTGYNGTLGKSPIDTHRDLITLDNTILEYVSNYFDNSTGTRIAVELGSSYPSRPADMDKLYANILPIFQKFVVGAKNAGKPILNLPDSKMSVIDQPSNVQAQLQGLMDMVEHQIATTVFGIPYEIIDSKASKYNSLESKQNDYLATCIRPLGDHICQSLMKLLNPGDTKLFIAYDYKTLLTTDTATTVDYLIKEFNNGAITLNEMRRKIGMDDIGEAGDYHFVASNLMPLTMENIEAYMAANKAKMEQSQEHNPNGDDK